jgi:hypothetical protein
MANRVFVDGYQISREIHCFHPQFRKAPSRTDDGGSNLLRRLGNVVQEGQVSHNLEQFLISNFRRIFECCVLSSG